MKKIKHLHLLLPSHRLKKAPKDKRKYVDLIFGGLLIVLVPLAIASLNHQKTTLASGLVNLSGMLIDWTDTLKSILSYNVLFVDKAWFDNNWNFNKAITVVTIPSGIIRIYE